MAGRTSARTAATRNQASSPPKQSTQSPVARRVRTRSASVELGDDNAGSTVKQGKRSARQASVESVGSNASAASSNEGGRRKKARRGEVLYPELSVVAEDPENIDEEDEEEAEVNEGSGHPPHSPGGMSQMSGTTAITSASAQTSHTTAELAGLDPLMVELLPQLWLSSLNVLTLLAPSNTSAELVESTVKELKVPGSRRAKRLRHEEKKFKTDRENFGTDEYIRTSFILQKVFGSQEVELGIFRPDAILQAANLATLIKDLLVKESQGQSTHNFLAVLDTWFPESFVSQFADNVYVGNSTMLDETFNFALRVRTQYTIAALRYHKAGEAPWEPDQILTELFYDRLERRTARLSYFDDVTKNGQIKNLLRAGPANSEYQDAIIRNRVLDIREAFRQSEDAAQAGDLVDFEQLDEQFPWSIFLVDAVQWTRSRLDEIEESIRQQGGVDNLVRSLIEAIKNSDSQVELSYNPHPSTTSPRQLLPSANIIPGTTGHNLLDKNTVRLLETLKQDPSVPPSNQSQRKATTSASAAAPSSNRNAELHRLGPSRTRATGPSEPAEEPRQVSEDFNPMVEELGSRRTADYLAVWDAHDRDKNKENRPLSGREKEKPAKRFIDAQANAQKVQWESQSSQEAGPSKRKHTLVETDDESDSQDEGFQADRRNPNPNRRMEVPAGRHLSPAPVRRPSPKRARVQEDEPAAQAVRRRQQQAEAELQASARREDSEGLDEDADEDPPRPSASQVGAAARREAVIARQRTVETQTRIPWSEADAEHLVDLIEDMGCSWSAIHQAGGFQVERGQVALKDKARNLKVQYLRSDVPLPLNFDKIALGQKEIRSVRAVRPDYEP